MCAGRTARRSCITNAAYTKTSGELAAIGKDSKSATLSTTDFVWGDTGAAVTGLTAYTIGGKQLYQATGHRKAV
jgi:hypothetical protein